MIILQISLIINSCSEKQSVIPIKEKINHYILLGHTRTKSNPNMDEIIEKINYSNYDMILLGGDLANLTSVDDATISHVDSIFNLGSPNTLWALGNHDYSNLTRISEYTHRPPYYSYYKDGVTFIVLDTQDSSSSIVGLQKEFFDSIVDTLEQSTHLILLHHKLIWMYGDSILQNKISSISNGDFGDCSYCINPNNFYSEIYPKLIEVKKRGTEVLCLAGDIGFKANEFEYETEEGIHFLASGINSGSQENKALLFTHNINKAELTWEFKLLTDL